MIHLRKSSNAERNEIENEMTIIIFPKSSYYFEFGILAVADSAHHFQLCSYKF